MRWRWGWMRLLKNFGAFDSPVFVTKFKMIHMVKKQEFMIPSWVSWFAGIVYFLFFVASERIVFRFSGIYADFNAPVPFMTGLIVSLSRFPVNWIVGGLLAVLLITKDRFLKPKLAAICTLIAIGLLPLIISGWILFLFQPIFGLHEKVS